LEFEGGLEIAPIDSVISQESVEITEWTSNSRTLRVQASGPRVLVLSESWYPGWRARVDGRDVPVFPANIAMVGLPLNAGEHTVQLAYRPRQFLQGAFVSAASLVILVLLLVRRLSGKSEEF